MRPTAEALTPRARAKRDQIRGAAQKLFLERGFTGVSTNTISLAAGVSKETLYKYFPNKEALLAECLEQLIADFSTEEASLTDQRQINSREELRRALLQMAQGLTTNLMQPDYLSLVRVIITETPRLPQLGQLFRDAVPENAFRRVVGLLEAAEKQGVVRSTDAEEAARMFVGPLLTYILIDGLFVGDGPIHRPSLAKLEAVVDLYLQAIVS